MKNIRMKRNCKKPPSLRAIITLAASIFILSMPLLFVSCSGDSSLENTNIDTEELKNEDLNTEDAVSENPISYETSNEILDETLEGFTDEIENKIKNEGDNEITYKLVDEGTPDCRIVYTNESGKAYELNEEVYCNSSMRSALSPDGRFLIYVDFPNIVLFDTEKQSNVNLMSVLDDTDGLDFYWAADSKTIAMSVVNTNNESYMETSGTKLYVLEVNEESELTQKDRHLVKMRYECHDAGCNVGPDDLYFTDKNTLIYRTWEDDPYSAAGDDSFLRSLKLQ